MSGTDPAVANLDHDLLMARSGEERMMTGFDTLDAAREIAPASLRAESQDDLAARLFVRFYGSDVSAGERVAIVEHLRRAERS